MSIRIGSKKSSWLTISETVTDLTNEDGTSLVGRPVDFRGFSLYNSGASTVWLQVFNAQAANVTLGTTKPVESFDIGAGDSRRMTQADFPMCSFSNGLSFAATSGQSNNTAPAASLTGRIFYMDNSL